MFDDGGAGCAILCCWTPIMMMILFIAAKVLAKIFDKRWLL
jgi:hypothetical protein